MRFLRLAVASVLFVSLAGCGRSEITALREKVAALEKMQNAMAQGFDEKVATLEKALDAQRQDVAQVRKDASQRPTQVLSEVRARSFVLVDDDGKTRALLDNDKGGPRLGLSDENGKEIWSAPFRVVK